MPVVITFNKISEKKPVHGESIIYLQSFDSFGCSGFEPSECEAEYCWFEIDSDGDDTGCQIVYNDEDTLEDCELRLIIGEYVAEDNTLWVSKEDYWKCFI